MRYGVDLSHHNIIDWEKLKADFVIYKCTEATSYLDPTYAKAKSSGKLTGSYHFARGGDAIKEADWYLKNSNESICVLDWEIDHVDPVKWCTAFINRLKEKGKFVWFYTNDARACKYPWPKDWIFWIARYGINDGTPIRKPDFKGYSVWQYTSNGTCPGVTGRVDLNIAEEWAFPGPKLDGITKWLEQPLPNPSEALELPQDTISEEVSDIPSDIPAPQPNFWTILWEWIKKLFV